MNKDFETKLKNLEECIERLRMCLKSGSKIIVEKNEYINLLEKKLVKKEITEKERSKGRSENYHSLTPQEQWAEDKELGILDWNGK